MSWDRVNGGKVPTWIPNPLARAEQCSTDDLRELPNGSVLRFELPDGLKITASKTNGRRWLLHSGGIDVGLLGDLVAIEMRRRE